MKKAILFPGQGSQYTGMGRNLYEKNVNAKSFFEKANNILGFPITQKMFEGSADELKETKVTQPAIFIHSVIQFLVSGLVPDMVAGHSLGEFSALVANGVLTFEDALKLVSLRANAMQKACETNPSTMAAVLGLEDNKVEEICKKIIDEIVVPANYNCPGQLVISGSIKGIELTCEQLKAAGAKRALVLPVGGAFHSPLMDSARLELKVAIDNTPFKNAICPIYQNVNAQAVTQAELIKENLIAQLTAPVRWTQSIQAMVQDGATQFIECGPGNVLQGLVKKIHRDAETAGIS